MFTKISRGFEILGEFFKDAYSSDYELYLKLNPDVKQVSPKNKIIIIFNGYINPKTNFLHQYYSFVKAFGWGNF